MSLPIHRASTPPSPKTLPVDAHAWHSIESQVADFHLYDLSSRHQARPSALPSIDPLHRIHHPIALPTSIESATIAFPPKTLEPINANTGFRRATAPPKIDFSDIARGFTSGSPPLSSPMIREQHIPAHYPFHVENAVSTPRGSFSRSSSLSSGTLVDSPERKGTILALSPTTTRINVNGTPIDIGTGSVGECLFGPRPQLPTRQSLSGIPALSLLDRGSLFPPRPELPRRHSSYRSVASYLANPDLVDASTAPEAGKTYPVKPLITKLQSHLSSTLSALKEPIHIVGILASDDSGCKTYASFLAKSSEKLGVKFELRQVELDEEIEREVQLGKVKAAIQAVNVDQGVNGLFLFLPIFGAEDDKVLRDLIDPRLDIEGISAESLAYNSRHPHPLSPRDVSLGVNEEVTVHPYPCTPLAVAHILQDLGVYNDSLPVGSRLRGKSITVINRSETVGMPLACLFANDGAQVYSVDINGISILVPNLGFTTLGSAASIAVHDELCATDIDPISDDLTGVLPEAGVKTYPNFTIHPAPQLSLETCLAFSDVIVSAVPSATYKVPTESLMPGCICVNVAEHSNFADNVCDRAKWLIPRVGGVTRLMVLFNALALVQECRMPLEG